MQLCVVTQFLHCVPSKNCACARDLVQLGHGCNALRLVSRVARRVRSAPCDPISTCSTCNSKLFGFDACLMFCPDPEAVDPLLRERESQMRYVKKLTLRAKSTHSHQVFVAFR